MIAANHFPPPAPPPAPQGPRKADILPAGQFAALPLDIMSRRDIHPMAKLVFQALLSHLAPNAGPNCPVWPSTARLAEMIGATQRGVKKALAELETAGLIAVERAAGRVSRYRFRTTNRGTQFPTTGEHSSPPPGNTVPHTGEHSSPPPGNSVPPNYLRESPKESPTPQPPATRGGECASPPGGEYGLVAIVAAWANAYRQAVGIPMDPKWHRRIRKECENGAAELLATIDAAAIRAGRRLAEEQGRPFGFGWVRNALDGRAAARQSRHAPTAPPPAAEPREGPAPAKFRDDLAAFRARPDREKWLAEAADRCFVPTAPDRMEMLAAALAAKEKTA